MVYEWIGCGGIPEPVLSGIGFAIRQSNLAGKVIVVLLFIGSILAWTVMLTKVREMRLARLMSFRFLNAYRKETHPANLFLKRSHFEGSPLYVVYDRTCLALGNALEACGAEPEDLFMGGVGSERRSLNEVQLAGVRNVAERTLADQALLLENKMGLLATSASTAPFLGLLGTVWGVMDAFGGMAVTGECDAYRCGAGYFRSIAHHRDWSAGGAAFGHRVQCIE